MGTPQRWPTVDWHKLPDGRVQCDLCPRECKLHAGQRGLCYIRGCEEDQIYLYSYGRSSGFCIDPIEKKPLYHFLPGTPVLSFGTAGCNLACKYCQNWDMSKSREMDTLTQSAMPETLAKAAEELKCRSVAFTYNDPVIFMEYAVDTAIACRERGVHSVAVTAGYISPKPRERFFSQMDAVNVDLKAFSESFYHKICNGHLQDVLDTLVYIRNHTNAWLEVTTLLIPGLNDSPEELEAMAAWYLDNLGPEVPWHFSAFHPDWKMPDIPPTPHATLKAAREIAIRAGIRYVYLGNVRDETGSITPCPSCQNPVIQRSGYQITGWQLDSQARCLHCQTRLDGIIDASCPGSWGQRYQPIALCEEAFER